MQMPIAGRRPAVMSLMTFRMPKQKFLKIANISQITMFDVTIPGDLYPNEVEVAKALNGWCKKYVFQKEQGDTGYVHWQCRVSLIKKRRMAEVLTIIVPKIGGHWSPTNNKVHAAGSFNYVMKEDTKIDGPWTEQSFMDPPKLTRPCMQNVSGHVAFE